MSHRRSFVSGNTVPMQSTMTAPRAYYLPEDAELSEVDLERGFSWNQDPGIPHPPGIHPEMHENMGQGNNQNDITEIYRRKSPENYSVAPEMMMSDEPPRYYYRPAALTRIPQRRLPIPINPVGPNNLGPYYPPPLEEPRSSYAEMLYRNQPHVQRVVHESNRPMTSNPMNRPPPRLMVDSNRTMTNLVRTIRNPTSNSSTKPVSVRTPRFYRRQNIYKRPSILCLQLPSTPDPSARPMKSRLPSTMPGLSLPPHMRAPGNNPYSSHQPMGCTVPPPPSRGHSTIIHHHREMDDRERGVRGRVSSRSAPPVMDERNKEFEDMERVRMIMENRNMPQEFGEDNLSVNNDQETENKCSELELLLNQYEQIFNTTSDGIPTSKHCSRRSKTRIRRRASVGRFIGLLKPKIPPSLKKQSSSKHSLKHSQSTRLEIEQMTAEVLDNLLKDLNAGGLVSESKQNTRSAKTNHSSSDQKDREEEQETETTNEKPSRDIEEGENKSGGSSGSKLEEEEKTTRSKKEEKTSSKKSVSYLENETKKSDSENIDTNTTFIQDQEKFRFESSSIFEKEKTHETGDRPSSPTDFDFAPDHEGQTSVPGSRDKDSCNKRSLWTNSRAKPEQDGTTALELHRSKSYIVNLIDRALSRELGTIPEERPSKQYLNLDPKTAMDLMQTKQLDTDMCLEISQAIADSFGKEPIGCPVCTSQPGVSLPASCCTKGSDRGDTVKDGELLFSAGNDEPLYIKQLKKLRWGHLKHIQREMRRLEDLERFLDSCGSEK